MPKALVILCVIGWVWTVAAGLFILLRARKSGEKERSQTKDIA